MNEGIITLYLVDPFSILISNFFNISADYCNAVGYYYHKDNICYVLLFNSFSPHKIFLYREREAYELKSLIQIAKNIKLYPLIFDISIGNPILTVEELNNSKKITKEQFYNHLNNDINKYGIIDDYRDFLNINNNITGFSIINKTLYNLRGHDNKLANSNKITNLNIFKPVIPIENGKDAENGSGGLKIIPIGVETQAKIEIEKFIDGLIHNNKIENFLIRPTMYNDVKDLVIFLYEAFNIGVIDKLKMQQIIKKLNTEGFSGTRNELLPIPDTNLEQINIINFSYTVLPHDDEKIITERKILQKISIYLNNLVTMLKTEEHPLINLQYLIHHFNKILIHKNIDQIANSIDVTEKITKTFLIENNPIKKVLLDGGDKNISLTIDNPNLDNLNKDELIKLLIYIDSLRSDDGLQDKKFIALQNKIVELLNKNIF